jgi:hypothetical protein
LPASITIRVTTPALPVAVKVTEVLVRPLTLAVRVFAPATVPRVQLPTVAIPLALVICDAPEMLPPPVTTAKVTATPATGLLKESLTRTLGASGTAVPTVTPWLFPLLVAICEATPAVPVAVKVTEVLVSPVTLTVRVLTPATVPIVHLPRAAIPLALVVCAAPVRLPPPEAMAKVTGTPATGFR